MRKKNVLLPPSAINFSEQFAIVNINLNCFMDCSNVTKLISKPLNYTSTTSTRPKSYKMKLMEDFIKHSRRKLRKKNQVRSYRGELQGVVGTAPV